MAIFGVDRATWDLQMPQTRANYLVDARAALEAAAPYIAADERADAWDEGRLSYRDDLAGTPSFGTPGYKETTNPYRSQA
jgi:hypothetical protein